MELDREHTTADVLPCTFMAVAVSCCLLLLPYSFPPLLASLLQDTWNAVLECVSRLEHVVMTPSISSSILPHGSPQAREAIVAALNELAAKPSEKVSGGGRERGREGEWRGYS